MRPFWHNFKSSFSERPVNNQRMPAEQSVNTSPYCLFLILVDCYNQILFTLCSLTVRYEFTDRYCIPFAKGFKQVCKTYLFYFTYKDFIVIQFTHNLWAN